MYTDASVSAFLDRLYDAAVMPGGWPDAVHAFGDLMAEGRGRVMSHMTVTDIQSGAVLRNVIVGAPADLVRKGREYYFSKDVFAEIRYRNFKEAVRRGQTGAVLQSSEALTDRDLHETEFYQDFLRPFSVNDMLSASTLVGGSRIVNFVANPIGTRTFQQEDRDLVLKLLPHIERAIGLSLKLGFADPARSASTLWSDSALPVMVVRQQRLIFTNQASDKLLEGDTIVRRSGKGIRFSDEDANAALKKISGNGQNGGSATDTRQAALTLFNSAGERWLLQMVRLKSPREEYFSLELTEEPAVLVLLTPFNAVSPTRAGSLDSIAGFSCIEREIITALVDGMTITQIAQATGRSEATLRWHVRNILEKTGLRSMTDLARFAALLLPL